MNKKTFIIIGLIFCLLFTMPMASAAENSADSSSLDDNFAIESDIYQLASADVDGFDIADENVSDDSVASISDSEEIADGPGGDINKNYNENNKNFGASILAADGSGNTFSDLKSIIENAIANGDDSVALDRDFEFTSGEDDSLTDGIVINSPITIIGGSHTIDAKNMARIFTISSNNVFLKDIVFKNANASNSNSHGAAGGAVYVETAGSAEEHSGISNSTFINCYSTGDGGALYVKSDYFTLSDSIFTDNTAGDDGGAIDWEGDYGEISNLTASGNSAISYGTSNSKGGTIIITGSCMKMDQLNITNSIAKADSGHNGIQGGAIFLTGNYCNITNAVFENCTVDFDGDDASGGALYIIGNFTNIICAEFINNSATEDGGAVFINGNDCTLNKTVFTGNIAHNDGGAIEWDGDNGIIHNLKADGNHADSAHGSSKGGTIIVTGDRIVMDMLNISNSHVNGPTYTGTNTIQGGAVFLTGNECNITNSRFENCFADHSKVEASGGALYILGNKSRIINVEISNASSRNDGSAVYVFGNNGDLEKVSISNSKSSSGDGTILISGSNTSIDRCVVDSSSAKNAGALKITGDGTNVSNSNFTNNNASAIAGAIEVLGSDTTITGCNISDNTASTNGGGVYYKGSRFTLQDSNIDHNSAKAGANIYLDKGSVSSHIIGCNITNAYANGGNSGYGGGVEWLENSVDGLIKDCYFYNLTSSGHGGAIHWYPGTNGQVDNCTFVECHVDGTKNGGAIYAGANSNIIPKGTILSNSTFINCTSGTRGAVNWNSVGGLIINNTFINCGSNSSATTQYGGRQALQIEKGNNTQILLCEFYNCTGIGGGGALRIQDQGENITIANCTFDGCSNTGTAGAVYISNNGKNIVFENNSFTNNSAPNTGALYADSRTTFSSFANNTFISNKATDASGNAGAVRFSGEAAIADSRFIDNSCNGAGGAIFANGKLNISGSTFENNTAGTNGGAISSNNGNGNLFVNESSFKYNKAPTGSAIRARSVNIENTELLENQALFDKWNNQRHSFTENHVSINGTFVGMDNYLNAINAGSGTFSNVVYCGVNGGGVDEGTTNTDGVTSAKSFNEVHQIVILEIFDENNNLVESIKQYTDASGNYNFEVDLSSDAQSYSYRISHPEDNYYTYAEYTLHKDSSVLNISCQNITYPEDENITFEVSGIDGMTPTGNITVVINDTDGVIIYNDTIQLSSGKAKLDFFKLNVSEYYIHARYNGDENYLPDNETAVFHVNQTKPSMDLGTVNITYGENETVVVAVEAVEGGTVPTGTVNITVTDEDGNSRTFNDVSLENGAAEKVISDLDAGNYTVQIVYSGDDNYAPDTKDGKFEVAKADAIVEIHVYDIIYGDIEELTVTCNALGNVTVYVNGINVTLSLDDGYEHRLFASLAAAYSGNARLDLENLAAGTYPASVHYNGDKNHNEADDDDTFHVIPQNTTVSVYVDDIKVGEDAIIKVELSPEAAPGNITVTIDGRDYNVELTNGKGQLAVPGFKAGEHDVVAKYPGSQNYTNSSNSTTFKVTRNTPEVSIDSQDINVGDMETITVTVPKDATGNVTITVAGKTYTAPVKDGKAVFNVPGLKAGNYAVDARYNGDDKYDSLDVNGTFTVSKVKPDMGISAATIKVGDDGTVTVTVPKDATGKITIEVAGKKYTALIKDGKAVFNVPGLNVGIHHIKAYYEGDEKYESSQADGYIEVVDDNHNGSHNKAHEDGIDLASIYTGNPVMVLILVLSFLGLLPLGRKRDDDE